MRTNDNSKKRLVAGLLALALAVLAATLTFAVPAGADRTDRVPKPTIVLMHGAWADGSSWNAVASRLQRQGFTVIAPANPLRGLNSDAAYLSSILDTIAGPIVLVGHSYGGMVMTNAATGHTNVSALVYIAAFAPDAGETLGGLGQMNPGSQLTPTNLEFRPHPGGLDVSIAPGVFRTVFASDLSADDAALMAAAQRPIDAISLTEPSGPPAWKTIPSWYLVATRDNAIPTRHPAPHGRTGGRSHGRGSELTRRDDLTAQTIDRPDPFRRPRHQLNFRERAMPAATAETSTVPVAPTIGIDFVDRPVKSITTAPKGFEGEGFPVRRAFAGVPLEDLDPFVHMDQMGEVDYAPGEPRGTDWHPHRGFETVTYIIDGEFLHQDSHGGGGSITNGATQWMTAGSGVLHIETPPESLVLSGGLFHGLQLWVNLPAAKKMIEPRYQNLDADLVKLLATADGGALVRLIAGQLGDHAGPGATQTPITVIHATVSPGERLRLPWPTQFNALAYALSGHGVVGPQAAPFAAGQLAAFGGGDAITITAAEDSNDAVPLEVYLLGGRPIREPVAQYGPFVMNDQSELAQALDDYRSGRLDRSPTTSPSVPPVVVDVNNLRRCAVLLAGRHVVEANRDGRGSSKRYFFDIGSEAAAERRGLGTELSAVHD